MATLLGKIGYSQFRWLPFYHRLPPDEEELERIILAYSPKFWSLLEKSINQIQDRGGIPHEDFWKEVEGQA